MADKETDFTNKLLAIGTVKQQVTFLQKKVRINEINTAIGGHRHHSIFQMPHSEKGNRA